MTDETPRRDPADEPVTPAPAPAAAPAAAVGHSRWRDRLPGRGVTLGVAVVALLLGCLLGGGMVAVAAFAGHDRDDERRHSDVRPGDRGERGGWPDRERREHGRPDRGRPVPVPSATPSAG